MNQASFEQTRSEALALSADSVVKPHIPVGVFRDECRAMLGYLDAHPEARARLLKTRVTAEDVARLTRYVDALDQSQRAWIRVRSGAHAQAHVDAIEQAQGLRAELLIACDYNTADDRAATARLKAIRDGDGLSDLISDLSDLKVFLDDHAAAFADDDLSDLDAFHAAIDQHLAVLHALVSATSVDRDLALDLRDRIWTLALGLMRAIRAGGRRAFHQQPVHLEHFRSDYEVSMNRRSRRKASDESAAPTPVDDLISAPLITETATPPPTEPPTS